MSYTHIMSDKLLNSVALKGTILNILGLKCLKTTSLLFCAMLSCVLALSRMFPTFKPSLVPRNLQVDSKERCFSFGRLLLWLPGKHQMMSQRVRKRVRKKVSAWVTYIDFHLQWQTLTPKNKESNSYDPTLLTSFFVLIEGILFFRKKLHSVYRSDDFACHC